MDNYFISCDWGTTNFRLRLVGLPGLNVDAEETSDKGVAELAKIWQQKGIQDERKRMAYYMDVLKDQAARLEEKAGQPLAGIPIIVSGMATSTIGLMNLPYQQVPVPLDGSGLKSHTIEA